MYTILIDISTNKAQPPIKEGGAVLYNPETYRAIQHVEFDNLVTACEADGCEHEAVRQFIQYEQQNETI